MFYKSSDCPVCPICDSKNSDKAPSFLSLLSAPARRALESAGVKSASQLAGLSKDQVLSMHGIGPASLPILERTLAENKLTWKAAKGKLGAK